MSTTCWRVWSFSIDKASCVRGACVETRRWLNSSLRRSGTTGDENNLRSPFVPPKHRSPLCECYIRSSRLSLVFAQYVTLLCSIHECIWILTFDWSNVLIHVWQAVSWPLYRDCGGKAGQNSDPRRPLQFLVYSVLLLNSFWRLIFTCIPILHRAPNLDNRPEKVRNLSGVPHYAQNYVTTTGQTFSSVGHFWT